MKFFIVVIFWFGLTGCNAQRQSGYSVHAHNDYVHEFPFWESYIAGAASIEADVFLEKGTLLVAHTADELNPENTLQSLYIEPIFQLVQKSKLRELTLLIDIKTEAESTLQNLIHKLRIYPQLTASNRLTIVVSGNRPPATDYAKYPDFIQFDHQRLDNLDTINLDKVAMLSVNFKNYSVWNGLGRPVEQELAALSELIGKAHTLNKPLRFWGSPDTKTAWSSLAKMGVDFINTDHPVPAVSYLNTLDKNTYVNAQQVEVYTPAFDFDYQSKPTNVVLMIGDGNGLAQITAAQIANQGELTLTQLNDIGFLKTASSDDLITDSAAGATAIATGFKTHNRAIGVDASDKAVTNITEILGERGYNTALISTDVIDGATPASFYAHRKERDDSKGILKDLETAALQFFIAGGKSKETSISTSYRLKTIDHLTDLREKAAVFIGENKVPSMANGRGDLLRQSVQRALSVLERDKKPFFLMIEAAQIDSNGHTNSASGIIQEMLDFDTAIAEVLKFADSSKNTLVIITADHETSGLGIVGGDLEQVAVQADFLTTDHTGIMVPVFSYGPQAQNFRGVFENNQLFFKMLNALGEIAKED
ncbi:alkaline phosphatase [Leeuwenhoekiella sp. NPDC079379]|uniref:alkaline phosphatase n=1 Tax=Leeuwenhoekiella sp. NPDC079379 TaxID=3364122 RepID=UPI0037C5C912